jgi:hypothetical protein
VKKSKTSVYINADWLILKLTNAIKTSLSQLMTMRSLKSGSVLRKRTNTEHNVSNSQFFTFGAIDKMDVLTKENAMILQKIVEAR